MILIKRLINNNNRIFNYKNNNNVINLITREYSTKSKIASRYARGGVHSMRDSYISSGPTTGLDIEPKKPKKRIKKDLKPEDIEKIMSTSYMTTQESSENEKRFEDNIKQLMIEQNVDHVSRIRIPSDLIRQLDFKDKFSPEALRFADYFFSHQSKLVTMAIMKADFPLHPFPQIAFLGRSNVGKSSLLNALLGNQLANVSKTPGCTQSVNFYGLWDKLMLVDLPGYGFSKVSKDKASVWGRSISEFLVSSEKLVKLFLLIDSRVGCQKNDLEVMKMLDEHRVAFQIVLTKIDKATPSGLRRIYSSLKESIADNVSCLPNIIQCSSHDSRGIQQIRTTILDVCQLDKQSFNSRRLFASLEKEPQLPPDLPDNYDYSKK